MELDETTAFYLVAIHVQADLVEIDFDVEHRPLEILLARFHRQNDSRGDVQRTQN